MGGKNTLDDINYRFNAKYYLGIDKVAQICWLTTNASFIIYSIVDK